MIIKQGHNLSDTTASKGSMLKESSLNWQLLYKSVKYSSLRWFKRI